MTLLAVALIVAAAFCHATWNLFVKRVSGGAEFTWLFTTCAVLLYAPFAGAVFLIEKPRFSGLEFAFIGGTALLHLGYFLTLQRGYRVGDLSLVYPLARGSGPMLASALAVLLLGERPTPLALCGAGLIIVSIFVMSGGLSLRGSSANVRQAVVYGLLTGLFIAAYTLTDKVAVSALLVPPLLYDWAANLGLTLLLTPLAVRRWNVVQSAWGSNRTAALAVAILSPLAYILVLTAMVFTPVSYVAPAREISILIGTMMGAKLLAEGQSTRRLLAAGGMVLGIVALALG